MSSQIIDSYVRTLDALLKVPYRKPYRFATDVGPLFPTHDLLRMAGNLCAFACNDNGLAAGNDKTRTLNRQRILVAQELLREALERSDQTRS